MQNARPAFSKVRRAGAHISAKSASRTTAVPIPRRNSLKKLEGQPQRGSTTPSKSYRERPRSRAHTNSNMAIERWFYHKFHHGYTLADVERFTHLLVGAQFLILIVAAALVPLVWLCTKPWLRAALRGDYSDQIDAKGRPGANWRPLPPKQKGSKRRKHDYPSYNRE